VQNRLSEKPVEVGRWILFEARLPRTIDNHNGILPQFLTMGSAIRAPPAKHCLHPSLLRKAAN
jgi:hypothetical protein